MERARGPGSALAALSSEGHFSGPVFDRVNAFALTMRDVRECAQFYRDEIGPKVQRTNDEEACLTFRQKGSPGLAILRAPG